MRRAGIAVLVGVAAAGLAAGFVAVVGQPGVTESAPSEAEAQALVSDLYLARSSPQALCDLAMSQGNCRVLLQGAGVAPDEMPTVVCSQEYAGDSTHGAGRLVTVRTGEGAGQVTMTFLAMHDADRAKAMNPVYWVAAGVSDGDDTDDLLETGCTSG